MRRGDTVTVNIEVVARLEKISHRPKRQFEWETELMAKLLFLHVSTLYYDQIYYNYKKKVFHKISSLNGRWWCTPLIPSLGRQRQADLCEFKASLVYKS